MLNLGFKPNLTSCNLVQPRATSCNLVQPRARQINSLYGFFCSVTHFEKCFKFYKINYRPQYNYFVLFYIAIMNFFFIKTTQAQIIYVNACSINQGHYCIAKMDLSDMSFVPVHNVPNNMGLSDITMDKAGNFYVSDRKHLLRVLPVTNPLPPPYWNDVSYDTLAVIPSTTSLGGIVSLAIDCNEKIYMGDLDNQRIWTYDLHSGQLELLGVYNAFFFDFEFFKGYLLAHCYEFDTGWGRTYLMNIHLDNLSVMDTIMEIDNNPFKDKILALSSLNTICESKRLIGPGYNQYLEYFVQSSSFQYTSFPGLCVGGATSPSSWMGSYTPLGIDSVTVRSVHNDCAPPYSLTAHTHKGYYMRPDIEFSLDGMTFQADSIFTVSDTGLYVIHVRDSFGCYRYSDTVSVGRHDLSSTAVVVEDYCGLASGAAVVYTKPGDMLSQDGQHYVADSLVLRDLVAGQYQYFISNALGCQDTGSFTIGQQAAFTLAASVLPDTCGRGHGSILLMPQGAHGYLSYSTDGQGYAYGAEIGGLSQGNYTYYVIDSAGCKVVFSADVAEIAGPAFSNLQIEPPDCGKSNGRLYVTADGQNITYGLNGTTNTTGRFDSLDAGTFVLSISDENQCRLDTTIQLSGKASISISSLKSEDAHCDLSNGMVEIQAADHTGIVTYSTDGINYTDDNIFTGLSAGQYIAYIRSEDDCISTAAFTIDQTGMPWFERVEVEDVTCSESNGRIGFTASGFQPLTYYLDGILRADTVISDLQEGIYHLEVKDAFGCDAVKEVEVKNQKEAGWTALGYTAGQCGSGMGTLYFGGSGNGVFYDLPALHQTMMPGDSLRLPYGKYEVRLHNSTCITDSVITIQGVACPYFIPNTFSPNHDGINDVFQLEGAAEVAEMRIFDRWGACLYASGRPDARWDGTFHGAAVTPGVYVYWVKVRLPDGSTEVRKGDVTVVR